MLTDKQIQFVAERGSDPELVKVQIRNFVRGFPFLNLKKPAIVGDGLLKLSDNEVHEMEQYYDEKLPEFKVLKFVPASGAASRMFKDLFSFLDASENTLSGAAATFIEGLQKFAFYNDLDNVLKNSGPGIQYALDNSQYQSIVQALLSSDGLAYGSLPKGLLKFHNYEDTPRTAMEEHLVEGANYSVSKGNQVNIHFTVSPEHLLRFKELVEGVQKRYEETLGVQFSIGFSIQKKSTDTIAVDLNNEAFLEKDGSILFRPAGHGALLENLNDLDADIIFIKNIDNVVPDKIKAETILYKKVIGGVLLRTREKGFHYLDQLEGNITSSQLSEIEDFLHHELSVRFLDHYPKFSVEEKVQHLKHLLDRPIKVCGMVVNQGEPGGGPFWVLADDGSLSLQIAESAQIDMNNPQQVQILKESSHFNPVDLVCSVTDRNGSPYDLLKFRDPTTGFITEKSKDGRELKAQELPGLWNGAMAFWNTVFVEVPIITFNPVKTVNDLLRDQHQNGLIP